MHMYAWIKKKLEGNKPQVEVKAERIDEDPAEALHSYPWPLILDLSKPVKDHGEPVKTPPSYIGTVYLKMSKLPSEVGPQRARDLFDLGVALFREGATFGTRAIETKFLELDPKLEFVYTHYLAKDILQEAKSLLKSMDKAIANKVTVEEINVALQEVEAILAKANSKKKSGPVDAVQPLDRLAGKVADIPLQLNRPTDVVRRSDDDMQAYLEASAARAATPFSRRK